MTGDLIRFISIKFYYVSNIRDFITYILNVYVLCIKKKNKSIISLLRKLLTNNMSHYNLITVVFVSNQCEINTSKNITRIQFSSV